MNDTSEPSPGPAKKRKVSQLVEDLNAASSSKLSAPGREGEALLQTSKTEERMRNDAVYVEGDLCIVSSDRVGFTLPSFYLLSASPIFRDMITIASDSEKRLDLVDPLLKTAAILRIFLDFLTGKNPYSINSHPACPSSSTLDIQKAADLATKYDCQQVYSNISSCLARHLACPHADPTSVFIWAAEREDWMLCAEALRQSRPPDRIPAVSSPHVCGHVIASQLGGLFGLSGPSASPLPVPLDYPLAVTTLLSPGTLSRSSFDALLRLPLVFHALNRSNTYRESSMRGGADGTAKLFLHYITTTKADQIPTGGPSVTPAAHQPTNSPLFSDTGLDPS